MPFGKGFAERLKLLKEFRGKEDKEKEMKKKAGAFVRSFFFCNFGTKHLNHTVMKKILKFTL